MELKCYSYKVARDFGFAPNPFYRYCTLATCKPLIRRGAKEGNWIIGTGTKKRKVEGRLIFAMCVSEKMSFNEYWNDPRFQVKKPIMNGSLKQTYGDNIYYFNEELEEWHQQNSHHSYGDGTPNMYNLIRDTQSDFVLISDKFYYFGSGNVEIPQEYVKDVCVPKQGCKIIKPESLAESFIDWIETNFETGYLGDPCLFKKFERYDGIS